MIPNTIVCVNNGLIEGYWYICMYVYIVMSVHIYVCGDDFPAYGILLYVCIIQRELHTVFLYIYGYVFLLVYSSGMNSLWSRDNTPHRYFYVHRYTQQYVVVHHTAVYTWYSSTSSYSHCEPINSTVQQ